MTDKQQTATQWLQNEMINKYYIASTHKCIELFKQALAMEREQIQKAYNQGIEATFQFQYGDGKQYFTDTYQSEP